MQFLLVSGLLAAVTTSFAAPRAHVVDVGYAKYQGTVNHDTGNVEFLGIRYAAAPTDAMRWREPQPPQSTPGVQLADTPPYTCMQAGNGANKVSPFLDNNSVSRRETSPKVPPPSEDCLFLNIAAPSSAKNLPVIIWIHGGGYTWGDAAHYTPDDLIREAGGQVVVVVIQYRLGVFGFLAGQKVHDGGALNAGLLDQQFAFQWVQKHISKFGGDPEKVTIWGQSCGGGSVILHLVANDGNTNPRLFRGGIASSAYVPPQYAYNNWIPERIFTEISEQSGCSSAPDVLDCLRQTDVNVLNQANINVTAEGFYGLLTFSPVVDGKFITDRPTVLLRRGKLNGDAALAVATHKEGDRPSLVDPKIADTVKTPEYIQNLFPELTREQIDEAVALYADMGKPIDQAEAINGESTFTCPSYFMLRALKGKGFKGDLAIPPAQHVDDIPYYFPNSLFGKLNATPPFENTEFKKNFAQSFLNFALSLDPNDKWDTSNTLPYWPRWTEEGREEMMFNKTEADVPVFRAVPTDEGLLRRCDYWESVGANIGQ
ncbi:hypothetical protein D9756_005145 [Leucocoprinus leucothites]|uniref:Carboxylesterase type B domain-containing protein n=1 Tax=Leucocoprinus leucothites TaxID=201217 RepID=A0A8H5G9V7_9AGAR|nr:hypothetical protein D9756_005145 [Leucoagaricus leucothites]